MSDALDRLLDPPYAAVAVRLEADLVEHVRERNERERNLLTVRGFGITSVSALLTATVVTGAWLLALFAGIVVLALIYADLDANRRVQAIDRRLPFLRSTAQSIRRVLAGRRHPSALLELRTNLRTYTSTPSGTDEVSWGIRIRSPFVGSKLPLRTPVYSAPGGLRVREALGTFAAVYGALFVGCIGVAAVAVGRKAPVQPVVGCVVGHGEDLRVAVEAERCPSPQPAVVRRAPACRVAPTVRQGRPLDIGCVSVRGRIAVSLRVPSGRVRSRTTLVMSSGRAAVRFREFRPGAIYSVAVSQGRTPLGSRLRVRAR